MLPTPPRGRGHPAPHQDGGAALAVWTSWGPARRAGWQTRPQGATRVGRWTHRPRAHCRHAHHQERPLHPMTRPGCRPHRRRRRRRYHHRHLDPRRGYPRRPHRCRGHHCSSSPRRRPDQSDETSRRRRHPQNPPRSTWLPPPHQQPLRWLPQRPRRRGSCAPRWPRRRRPCRPARHWQTAHGRRGRLRPKGPLRQVLGLPTRPSPRPERCSTLPDRHSMLPPPLLPPRPWTELPPRRPRSGCALQRAGLRRYHHRHRHRHCRCRQMELPQSQRPTAWSPPGCGWVPTGAVEQQRRWRERPEGQHR